MSAYVVVLPCLLILAVTLEVFRGMRGSFRPGSDRRAWMHEHMQRRKTLGPTTKTQDGDGLPSRWLHREWMQRKESHRRAAFFRPDSFMPRR